MNIDDTVGLYLKEMSRVPLLSLSEEVELAECILAGRIAQIELNRSTGTLPAQQRKDYQQQVESGQLARDHLDQSKYPAGRQHCEKIYRSRCGLSRFNPGG